MALTAILRKARELLAVGWNAECCLALSQDGYPVYSWPRLAGVPSVSGRPIPECMSFDVDGAVDHACWLLDESAKGLPEEQRHNTTGWALARYVEAIEFLDGIAPRDGCPVWWPGDVRVWEMQQGRTQSEVLRLFDRALMRAARVEMAT